VIPNTYSLGKRPLFEIGCGAIIVKYFFIKIYQGLVCEGSSSDHCYNCFLLVIQTRLLRSAKYYLDKDRKDKFQAHGIDTKCASLENTSAGLRFAKDAVKVEKK